MHGGGAILNNQAKGTGDVGERQPGRKKGDVKGEEGDLQQ